MDILLVGYRQGSDKGFFELVIAAAGPAELCAPLTHPCFLRCLYSLLGHLRLDGLRLRPIGRTQPEPVCC